jgi:putative peptidoglycan lipid II flippase
MVFLRSLATVGGFTCMSRLLGYVRDLFIASVLGAGPLSDAFFVALKLPNLFRRLFAEGAFNAAFVPLFSKISAQSPSKSIDFAHTVLTQLFLILLVMVIGFEVGMPWIIKIITPGFACDPEKFNLTIALSRITFPYILFISLGALLGGVLNTLHKFAASTVAPVILNIFSIVALVLFSGPAKTSAHALSWAICLSGIFQLIWVAVACHKEGIPIKFVKPTITPHTKNLFKRMIPGMIGAGVYQFNMFMSDIVASFVPSAISYLSFADRINQLPLSIIGIAMGTVLLPHLSNLLHHNKTQEALALQNQAMFFALFLTLPAAVGLFLLSPHIVEILFQRGEFTSVATKATSLTLSAFVTGLPAYVIVKVLSTNFFARGDTSTPVKIASLSIFVNLILNLILVQIWQYVGIAVATSIASWLNMAILMCFLIKKGFLNFTKPFIISILKLLLATATMGFILSHGQDFLALHFPHSRGLGLLLLILLGLGSYLGIVYFTKTINFKDLKQAFR